MRYLWDLTSSGFNAKGHIGITVLSDRNVNIKSVHCKLNLKRYSVTFNGQIIQSLGWTSSIKYLRCVQRLQFLSGVMAILMVQGRHCAKKLPIFTHFNKKRYCIEHTRKTKDTTFVFVFVFFISYLCLPYCFVHFGLESAHKYSKEWSWWSSLLIFTTWNKQVTLYSLKMRP